MLDIAFKDFKAKKSRAAMCIIGVMTCVMLIGVVNIITYQMEEGFKGDVNSLTGKLYFEKTDTGYPPLTSIISENTSDQVLSNSVVNPDKSTALLMNALPGSTSVGSTPVMIVGLTPGKEQAYINGVKVNGSDSLVGASDNTVILGSEAAKKYNVTVGDTFTVNDQQFKVMGVISKQGKIMPTTLDSSVIGSLSFVQSFAQRPGLVSTVIITPNNNVSLQDARSTLQNSFNNSYGIYTQSDAQKTFNDNFQAMYVFMDMITAMIFIVSTVLIMNVMMMSVKEKTKEIGTMRAIGTSKKRILSLILYESLILSSIGGLIGILLIIPAYNLLGMALGSTSLSFTIPLNVLIQVALVVIVIGTLSGLIPAYKATSISPIEALRYE
jgi:putative ABC transport system permease protein